ncbi:MAG TPA: hypothetical protein EYQ43_00320 [Methyloprofundus sp.]|nr:hypothetical protein [Methyloprofundus sp.]
MAAYLSVFVAPCILLPPEIPGMEATDLAQRQNGWLLTVSLTGIGLAILAFSSRYYKGAGLILILLPDLIGAPESEIPGFNHAGPDAVIMLTDLWPQNRLLMSQIY